MNDLAKRCYEDVHIGDMLPGVTKEITHNLLVRYSGAVGDFNPIHTDPDFARAAGLGGVVAHGLLSMAFVNQMMVEWLGDPGLLRQLRCRFAVPVRPGDTITTGGVVAEKREERGQRLVVCEVWAENQRGERVVTHGFALATLPSQDSLP